MPSTAPPALAAAEGRQPHPPGRWGISPPFDTLDANRIPKGGRGGPRGGGGGSGVDNPLTLAAALDKPENMLYNTTKKFHLKKI